MVVIADPNINRSSKHQGEGGTSSADKSVHLGECSYIYLTLMTSQWLPNLAIMQNVAVLALQTAKVTCHLVGTPSTAATTTYSTPVAVRRGRVWLCARMQAYIDLKLPNKKDIPETEVASPTHR